MDENIQDILMIIKGVKKGIKFIGCGTVVAIIGIILLVLCMPHSQAEQIVRQGEQDKNLEYVQTADYFGYDWELLLAKDLTLHNNDVSQLNPLTSMLDLTEITQYLKIETKRDGVITVRITTDTYAGQQIPAMLHTALKREIPYTNLEVGNAVRALPSKYELLSDPDDNPTIYQRYETKYATEEEIEAKYFDDKDLADQFFIACSSGVLGDYIEPYDTELSGGGNVKGTKDYGDVIFSEGATNVVYYNQTDTRWAQKPYGDSTIGRAGCGPTALAIVVSTFKRNIDPLEMSTWAAAAGYKAKGGGSYYSLMTSGAESYGINVTGNVSAQQIVDALSSGKLVVAIMGPGTFTRGGHYIVLRGVTADGKILVADPNSYKRSQKAYDLSLIISEAKQGIGSGGPFWIMGK